MAEVITPTTKIPDYDFKPRNPITVEQVRDQLDLIHTMPNLTEGQRHQIEQTIGETAVDVIPILEIIPPTFHIRALGKLGRRRKVVPKASADPYEIAVYFSPEYISFIANKLDNAILGPLVADDLRWATAHELYHMKVFERHPRHFDKSAKKFTRSAYSARSFRRAWATDWGELGADLFALHYVKNRRTPDLKEKLSKTVWHLWGPLHIRMMHDAEHFLFGVKTDKR